MVTITFKRTVTVSIFATRIFDANIAIDTLPPVFTNAILRRCAISVKTSCIFKFAYGLGTGMHWIRISKRFPPTFKTFDVSVFSTSVFFCFLQNKNIDCKKGQFSVKLGTCRKLQFFCHSFFT